MLRTPVRTKPNLRRPLEVFVLHALIFANGELQLPAAGAPPAEAILAVDGGLAHCAALGLTPQALIGDLDSVDPAQQAAYAAQGVDVQAFPPRKDETDFELALAYALQIGAETISVLAGLGRRWDHSLANLLLAASPRFAAARITFLHGEQRLFAFRGSARLDTPIGSRVSLIPLGRDAYGVSTTGLEYPLTEEDLPFGSTRGVSNVAVAAHASVRVKRGVLLCILSPGELN